MTEHMPTIDFAHLRQLRADVAAAEKRGRVEQGATFTAIVAEPRRRLLAAVLAALDAGARQVDIAAELGVTRGRAHQLVKEARGGTSTTPTSEEPT